MTQLVRSPKQLGTLIHNARISRNLTQQALADLVGTGQKTVSRIESGDVDHTQVDTLRRYAEALGGTLRVEVEIDGSSFQIA